MGCRNPHKCADKAHTRLNLIPPKHNPTKQELPDGMSLTTSRKLRNKLARQTNGKITFDPSITCKVSLAEGFWIFMDPNRNPTQITQRYRHRGPISRCEEIMVYTDRACMNNSKMNARCRSGVWFT